MRYTIFFLIILFCFQSSDVLIIKSNSRYPASYSTMLSDGLVTYYVLSNDQEKVRKKEIDELIEGSKFRELEKRKSFLERELLEIEQGRRTYSRDEILEIKKYYQKILFHWEKESKVIDQRVIEKMKEYKRLYENSLESLHQIVEWDYQAKKVIRALESGVTDSEVIHSLMHAKPDKDPGIYVLERFGIIPPSNSVYYRSRGDGHFELPIQFREVFLNPIYGVPPIGTGTGQTVLVSDVNVKVPWPKDHNLGFRVDLWAIDQSLRDEAKLTNKFVSEIYKGVQDRGDRSVFTDEFLDKIDKENNNLNPFRLIFYNYRNAVTGELVATVSMFDGSEKDSIYGDARLPLERSMSEEFGVQGTIEGRSKKNKRVIEIRRLAKNKEDKNFKLSTVLMNIADFLKQSYDIEETDLYLHTDEAGSILYQRFGFEVELNPTQLATEDHYIMKIKAETFMKKYASKNKEYGAQYLPRVFKRFGEFNPSDFYISDYEMNKYIVPDPSKDGCYLLINAFF